MIDNHHNTDQCCSLVSNDKEVTTEHNINHVHDVHVRVNTDDSMNLDKEEEEENESIDEDACSDYEYIYEDNSSECDEIINNHLPTNIANFTKDFCLSDIINTNDKVLTHIYSILRDIASHLDAPALRWSWNWRSDEVSSRFKPTLYVTSDQNVKHALVYDFSNWCDIDTYALAASAATTTTTTTTTASDSSASAEVNTVLCTRCCTHFGSLNKCIICGSSESIGIIKKSNDSENTSKNRKLVTEGASLNELIQAVVAGIHDFEAIRIVCCPLLSDVSLVAFATHCPRLEWLYCSQSATTAMSKVGVEYVVSHYHNLLNKDKIIKMWETQRKIY